MTVVASVAIDAEEFALGRALADDHARIDLTQLVPMGEQIAPYFWVEEAGDLEAFERRVRESPQVDDLEHLDGRVNRRLYRVDWSLDGDGFLSSLIETDVLVEEATATPESGDWHFRLRAVDQDALSTLQRRWNEHDVPVDVRRVVQDPSEDGEGLRFDLTDKQYEALRLAYEEGYFEVPRQSSLGSLADALDISRQALSRRLMRAEHHVFRHLFIDGRDGP